MKKGLLIAMLLGAAIGASAEPQATCPVMGGKIQRSAYVDVEGYRIYVCCKGCISAIKADPQKYIQKLQSEGVEIEKTPAAPEKK